MKNLFFLFLALTFSFTSVKAQNTQSPFNEPPSWAKNAIWYQIFVERFNNGDKTNDPKPENMDVPFMKIKTPAGWSITPWTHDWYKQEAWAVKSGKSFNDAVQFRRYGGDLQGVLNKLDYLHGSGCNRIIF